MTDPSDTPFTKIRDLAEAALQVPGTPSSVTDALRQIVSLVQPSGGDTPGASDLPQTDNQSL